MNHRLLGDGSDRAGNGNIEEKILTLQEKKAELGAGIRNEDRESMARFGEDDIRDLLAALPD